MAIGESAQGSHDALSPGRGVTLRLEGQPTASSGTRLEKGLDLRMRERLTFSMRASLGGCEPRLAGHVAGNLAAGNDRQALVDAVVQLLPFIGYPRTLNALRVINEGTSA